MSVLILGILYSLAMDMYTASLRLSNCETGEDETDELTELHIFGIECSRLSIGNIVLLPSIQ